jgi:son of sevenless-like protein
MKTATVIAEIQTLQMSRYDFTEVKELKSFLENKIKTSRLVQDLYDMSMDLEPRETEETRITRTLMESGLL